MGHLQFYETFHMGLCGYRVRRWRGCGLSSSHHERSLVKGSGGAVQQSWVGWQASLLERCVGGGPCSQGPHGDGGVERDCLSRGHPGESARRGGNSEGAGVEEEGDGGRDFPLWLPRNRPSCRPWHSPAAGVNQSIEHSRGPPWCQHLVRSRAGG